MHAVFFCYASSSVRVLTAACKEWKITKIDPRFLLQESMRHICSIGSSCCEPRSCIILRLFDLHSNGWLKLETSWSGIGLVPFRMIFQIYRFGNRSYIVWQSYKLLTGRWWQKFKTSWSGSVLFGLRKIQTCFMHGWNEDSWRSDVGHASSVMCFPTPTSGGGRLFRGQALSILA